MLPNQDPNSLKGTLPPEKTLPMGQMDQLDLLKIALRDTSQLAYNKGMSGSGQAVLDKMGSFGYTPSNVSGGTLGNIMQFVSDQTATPIEKEFSTMQDILTGIRTQQDKLEAQKEKIKDDARQLMSTIASQAPDVFKQLTADEMTSIQNGDIPDTVYSKIGESASKGQALDLRYKELQNRKLEQDINNNGPGNNSSIGSALGLSGKNATNFDTDLETEINNVYNGDYNRETALAKLQAKYPSIKDSVSGVIYGNEKFNAVFPNGYESRQKKSAAEEKQDKPQFDEPAMVEIAKALLKSSGSKEKAKEAVGYRKLKMNNKEVELTEATVNRIKELIDQQQESNPWYHFGF